MKDLYLTSASFDWKEPMLLLIEKEIIVTDVSSPLYHPYRSTC